MWINVNGFTCKRKVTELQTTHDHSNDFETVMRLYKILVKDIPQTDCNA